MAQQPDYFAQRHYESRREQKRRVRQEAAVYRAQANAVREAERLHKVSERETERLRKVSERETERLQKVSDHARRAAAKAQAEERERRKEQAARAHEEAQLAEVRCLNASLDVYYEEIDNLLQATLGVDDYVDLEALRLEVEHVDVDPSELAVLPPIPPPSDRRHDEAIRAHERAHREWQQEGAKSLAAQIAAAERQQQITELIEGLAAGQEAAVQEYVKIVLANSVYPDDFPVTHRHTFDLASRQLELTVTVPPPTGIQSVKEYEYVRARDEIRPVMLPQREQSERYDTAVFQVALRTLHEVFEADRGAKINAVSLKVASFTISSATGREEPVPLVLVKADRETFTSFGLANVIPKRTLEYLGAILSASPFDLSPAGEVPRGLEAVRELGDLASERSREALSTVRERLDQSQASLREVDLQQARDEVRELGDVASERSRAALSALRKKVDRTDDLPLGKLPFGSRLRRAHGGGEQAGEGDDTSDASGPVED